MKLQVNDLVHIKCGRSEYVEKIEGQQHHNNYFKTSNFLIRDDFTASQQQNPAPYMFYYSIQKVWRLDEHDNYIRIYPEPEKEEAVVDQAKEINELKKGSITMSEIEYKDYIYKKAKKVKTREDLDKLLDEVINCKELDYSQIVYAMCACMNATFNYINENSAGGGITGFQAGFIGWEMLKKYLALEDNKCGLKLVDYDDMLYPQYEKHFRKTISKDNWNSLQAEARKKLKENEACKEVLNHCKKIASGEVPFGYTVREE